MKSIPNINTRTYVFTDYFKGFDKSKTVKKIFGEKTEEILATLKVQFTSLGGYMWVNPEDGHIIVNSRYVNGADKIDIHLDIIHELVHVRQFMEGKDLFDANYGYVERPTEIEAYLYAVEEARRMGIGDRRILQYLEVEWLSDSEIRQLATTLDVATDQTA